MSLAAKEKCKRYRMKKKLIEESKGPADAPQIKNYKLKVKNCGQFHFVKLTII